MRKLLGLVLIIFSISVTGQPIKFSASLGANYTVLETQNSFTESYTFSLSDSINWMVTKINTEWGHEVKALPGAAMDFNIHFPISKNVVLRTGMGVDYKAFEMTTSVISTARDESFGTLITSNLLEFLPLNRPDQSLLFECSPNEFNQISFPGSQIRNDILYLRIPIGIEITVLDNDLAVYVGGFFSNIIYREIGYDCNNLILIDPGDPFPIGNPGNNSSKHTVQEDFGINNALFGGELAFGYRLFDQLFLEGKLGGTFNSIFDKGQTEVTIDRVSGRGINAKMQTATLGVRYLFKSKNKEGE